MSLAAPTSVSNPIAEEIQQIGSRWGHFLALGVMLIAVGALAICYSGLASELDIETLGFILVAGGLVQAMTSFWASGWSGFFVQLSLGILYAVAGTIMIRHPLAAAESITLVLALAYIAGGLIRLAFAVTHRTAGSGWIMVNGVVTFTLGLMIWTKWPWDSLVVIGLFLGIDLVLLGWSWAMLGIAARLRTSWTV